MKKVLSLFVLCLSAVGAMAQVRSMTGKVLSSDDGLPLMGVTITVTGTEKRTITDFEGNFSLSDLRPEDKTITLSFIGMATKTVRIEPVVNVTMDPDSEFLQETIVVAFGKQTREAFTGSATVVKSDELTRQAVSDPISALSGKVPGLTVLASNNPARESTINIRGLGSINASTSPLIVVDGQPYSGSWRDINPSDVDNISVLKDAASNALYGARGANGVIMITTKSAQKGTTRVTLDMKCGLSTDAQVDYDKIDNPGEYYEAHYLALKNFYMRSKGMQEAAAHLKANSMMCGPSLTEGGLGYIVYSLLDGEALIGSNGRLNPAATLGGKIYNNGNWYTLYPDDWKKAGLRNGLRQEYNLNVSGGKDGMSMYASLGHLDQQGITYGSDVRRTTARLKTDYQAYKWLGIGAGANYSHSDYNDLSAAFSDAYSIAPIYPLYLRDGDGNIMTDARGNRYDYGDGTLGFFRPILKNTNNIQSDRLDQSESSSNNFGINGYANIDLPLGFRITVNGSVYVSEYRNKTACNPWYGYFSTTGGYTDTAHGRQVTENYQQLLSWKGSFGRHNVDFLAGHEYNRRSTTYLSGSKSGVAMFEQNTELDGAVVDNEMSGSTTFYNVEGFLARAQYDYDGKYFTSASFRCDGSSRFHPDHRWGCFWSLGGAWIISKEDWFPKSPAVDMLKFKASYGEQGNDGLSSSFYWTDYYDIVNSNDKVAYVFKWKGNPDITWETTGAFNSGVEFGLFKGRLNGSLEFYSRKTRDMLYVYSVSSSNGYSGYYDNIGDMVNRGIEANIDAAVLKVGDFTWNVNLNFSWERNSISFLPESNKREQVDGHWGYPGSYYFYGEGLPMYTWYIQKYSGPDSEGQPTWLSHDDEGNVIRTSSYEEADKFDCGTALPTFYGGFGTSLSFKGFDISANFTFSLGGRKMDNGYLSLMGSPYGSAVGGNIHRDALKGWSETNTDSLIPRWQFNDYQNNLVSDFFLASANQLTLRNIQIGYSLPKNVLSRIHVGGMRVSLSCDGVAYWTARRGFDPRSSRTSYSGTGYGPMRTYMAGLNIQF